MPETRVHRSASKGAPHFLWIHTEKSLELGNCDGSIAGREWFSFRANGRYIVAPPSTFEGKEYTVFADIAPQPIPDWVVDRIRANGTREKDFGAGLRPVHEDFDFDAFVEWVGGVEDEDGSWYPFRECPVAGRRHRGQGTKGCALYYDGGTLGFKCMAAECPSNMDRKPGQGGISFLVSFLSKENGAYEGVIWPERKDQLGAVSAEQQEKRIEAIGGKALPPGEKPLAQVTIDYMCKNSTADAAALAPALKPEEANPVSAEEPAKDEEPKKKHRGLYRMPETSMYGWLGDMARKLDAPLGLAYPALLAIYSGRNMSHGTKSIRPNVYVCLIADKHEGKSRTMKRAGAVIRPNDAAKEYSTLTGSDAGLVEMLGGKKDDKIDVSERYGMPRLIVEDEMQDAMNKMDIRGSSLPNKLNRLFYYDEVRHVIKKSNLTAYATLSIVGGLTVSSVEDFTEMWGKNTVSGLYDRFIFAVAPKGWRWDDAWEEEGKVEEVERRPAPVKVDKEIFNMKDAWVDEDRLSRARLGEVALRIAVITTAADAGGVERTLADAEDGRKSERSAKIAADGYAHVTPECMRCALEFCEWQEAICAKYKPSKADTPGGKLAELIVEDFKRCRLEDGTYAFASWRDRYRKNSWHRRDGKGMTIQRDALVENGVLEPELEPEFEESGKVKKLKKTGRYRYVSDGSEVK